jgi:hypothetical protein
MTWLNHFSTPCAISCGSEAERVKILYNVVSYSLNASTRSIGLYYLSYNETLTALGVVQ